MRYSHRNTKFDFRLTLSAILHSSVGSVDFHHGLFGFQLFGFDNRVLVLSDLFLKMAVRYPGIIMKTVPWMEIEQLTYLIAKKLKGFRIYVGRIAVDIMKCLYNLL